MSQRPDPGTTSTSPDDGSATEPQRRRGLRSLPPPVLALLVLAVLVLVLVGLTRFAPQATSLQQAVAATPADTQRWSFTDWEAVRERLGVVGTDPADLEALLDDGYDADLTSRSGLVEAATLLDEVYGWSPLTADWEVLAQGTQGAVEVLRVPAGPDEDLYPGFADALSAAGYTAPSDPTSGVWAGGDDVVAALESSTGLQGAPQLAHVALLADDDLVLLSDNRAYLEDAVAGIGEGTDDAGVTDALDAVDAAGTPLSVALLTGSQACTELSMAEADPSDEEVGASLIAQAGDLDPLAGWAMAALDGDGAGDPEAGADVLVAMAFENEDQATDNATTRATLASGEAPGQGGTFPERFSVEETAVDGDVATLRLAPADGPFLSDLSEGPLLFAACR
ncbi:hypothetical protein [Nocardioides bruguierae]|uniref:hypothetical protein n=1 Tax=Nocardioides bruguierae TaxID=2945102 RepID=UPI002021670C|nr:hypothetical protein [Nocardioides bruguierae]MCL8026215.1 hypothetical protein [Nocardioides bruguierae]